MCMCVFSLRLARVSFLIDPISISSWLFSTMVAGHKRQTIDDFVTAHFLKEPVEANRTGPRPKKKGKKEVERKIEAQMYQFSCLTCAKSFRDSSNKKALEHKLLTLGAGCAHCSDPQITPHQIKSLMDVGVEKAVGFKERLQSFVNLKRIDKEQPSGDGGPAPMTGPELKELQKEQIKAAFAKGSFTVNSEKVEEYTDFLKKLNPRLWARLHAEI